MKQSVGRVRRALFGLRRRHVLRADPRLGGEINIARVIQKLSSLVELTTQ